MSPRSAQAFPKINYRLALEDVGDLAGAALVIERASIHPEERGRLIAGTSGSVMVSPRVATRRRLVRQKSAEAGRAGGSPLDYRAQGAVKFSSRMAAG